MAGPASVRVNPDGLGKYIATQEVVGYPVVGLLGGIATGIVTGPSYVVSRAPREQNRHTTGATGTNVAFRRVSYGPVVQRRGYAVAPSVPAVVINQAAVTSIPVQGTLTGAVPANAIISVGVGLGSAELFTATSAGAAVGATSIPVVSQTAIRSHYPGDPIGVQTTLEQQWVTLVTENGAFLTGPYGGIKTEVLTLPPGGDQTNNRQLVTGPNEWVGTVGAAVNTQAVFTKAAAVGIRHIIHSLACSVVAGNNPPPSVGTVQTLEILDGAGVLWLIDIGMQPVGGYTGVVQISGLNIGGTPGNAMTVQWLVAPGANAYQSVAISGISVTG